MKKIFLFLILLMFISYASGVIYQPLTDIKYSPTKQIQNKKNQDHSRKINSEQLLFLRSEWIDEWEPGLEEHFSQLIILEDGSTQFAIFTRKEIFSLYTGSLQVDNLLSKAFEFGFFKLKKYYITKIIPWKPIPEGHSAQISITLNTSKRRHAVFAEQELMPSSLKLYSLHLNELVGELLDKGQRNLQNFYIRIIPLSNKKALEIKKLNIYKEIKKEEVESNSVLKRGLITPYRLVGLVGKEKKIIEKYGKRKGKHFYPYIKYGPTLYKILIYLKKSFKGD